MRVEVALLDGGSVQFDLESKDTGADLLEKVARHLNLTEKDYFGFLVLDKRDKIWTWLHNERKVNKQVRPEEARLLFQVSENTHSMAIKVGLHLPGEVLPSGARSAARGSHPLPNVPANPERHQERQAALLIRHARPPRRLPRPERAW